jgi:hypothetical protein
VTDKQANIKTFLSNVIIHQTHSMHINALVLAGKTYFKICKKISYIYISHLVSNAVSTLYIANKKKTQTPWRESASELYWPNECHLLLKLVPTFADRACCEASVTDPYGCILNLLDWSRYFFFQVAPQLYSRG